MKHLWKKLLFVAVLVLAAAALAVTAGSAKATNWFPEPDAWGGDAGWDIFGGDIWHEPDFGGFGIIITLPPGGHGDDGDKIEDHYPPSKKK